jgi:hypothetical protein
MDTPLTWGTKAVKHPIELLIAMLAVTKVGKSRLSQAAHTMIDIQKSEMATLEIIFVKNQTSRWIVVNLNFVAPDIATRTPMMDLSPMAKTTPVHAP